MAEDLSTLAAGVGSVVLALALRQLRVLLVHVGLFLSRLFLLCSMLCRQNQTKKERKTKK